MKQLELASYYNSFNYLEFHRVSFFSYTLFPCISKNAFASCCDNYLAKYRLAFVQLASPMLLASTFLLLYALIFIYFNTLLVQVVKSLAQMTQNVKFCFIVEVVCPTFELFKFIFIPFSHSCSSILLIYIFNCMQLCTIYC